MTLNEAIKKAEDQYFQEIENARIVCNMHGEFSPGYHKHCQKAEEHKQLADWLKELRDYRNMAP